MSTHTPGPWQSEHSEPYGLTICQHSPAPMSGWTTETIARIATHPTAQDRANAAFIVSACNAHERLVEALEMAQACLGDIVRAGSANIDEVEAYSAARNALALARGKELQP